MRAHHPFGFGAEVGGRELFFECLTDSSHDDLMHDPPSWWITAATDEETGERLDPVRFNQDGKLLDSLEGRAFEAAVWAMGDQR